MKTKTLFTVLALVAPVMAAGQTQSKRSESIEASVHIINLSTVSQMIGTELYGVHGVINWISENRSVHIQGGSPGCLQNLSPPQAIVLKPDQIYEQTCEGFIITCYLTDRLKEGHEIWRK